MSPTTDIAEAGVRPCTIVRWNGAPDLSIEDDDVAVEEPLEIRVRGRSIAVTMRTPGGPEEDAELAAGFLLSEGVIRSAGDLVRVDHCGRNEDGNVINAVLAPEVAVDFGRLTRHIFASSSCGLCGTATIDNVRKTLPRLRSHARIDHAALAELPRRMKQAQHGFARTGGVHAAGLFDVSGRLAAVREDVGRHNAVDKALGFALRAGLTPLGDHVLLVSGRASFEIVQKALAAGVAIVAAVSAPSSLAVDLARESGMTLVAFLRRGRMNIYSGSGRITRGS